jgi:CO/xanthine dehydrogenase Mo-binding subunit
MERVESEIEVEDGKHKVVKFIKLTDAGKVFDPNAVEDAE